MAVHFRGGAGAGARCASGACGVYVCAGPGGVPGPSNRTRTTPSLTLRDPARCVLVVLDVQARPRTCALSTGRAGAPRPRRHRRRLPRRRPPRVRPPPRRCRRGPRPAGGCRRAAQSRQWRDRRDPRAAAGSATSRRSCAQWVSPDSATPSSRTGSTGSAAVQRGRGRLRSWRRPTSAPVTERVTVVKSDRRSFHRDGPGAATVVQPPKRPRQHVLERPGSSHRRRCPREGAFRTDALGLRSTTTGRGSSPRARRYKFQPAAPERPDQVVTAGRAQVGDRDDPETAQRRAAAGPPPAAPKPAWGTVLHLGWHDGEPVGFPASEASLAMSFERPSPIETTSPVRRQNSRLM